MICIFVSVCASIHTSKSIIKHRKTYLGLRCDLGNKWEGREGGGGGGLDMTGMMCKIEQNACPRSVPNSHPFLTKLLLLFAKVWKASYWRLKTSLLIRAVHIGFTNWQYLIYVCFLGMLTSSDMGRNYGAPSVSLLFTLFEALNIIIY